MNNITGLHLYINDDLNLVVDDHRGETVKHKVISLNTFCKMIDRSTRKMDVASGLLPERCICYRETDSGERFVAIDLGRNAADITYEQTKYENFPIPRLLFGFRMSKDNRIAEVQIAVADMGTLRDDTRLYMEYCTMLEHLKDKDSAYYYENVLIPSGKTLKSFIYGG